MKKVLITGANSYIGMSFEKYIKDNYSKDYLIDTIDMLDGSWREKSFSKYDVVYHVAGIAHSDSGKISTEKEKLYRNVNTELTVEVAEKARADGVKQFIFMSSAIVYGDSAPIGKKKIITNETIPMPANCYGDSKLQAELRIMPLQSNTYKVCVLRPPMIFGPGCKGNYATLSKLAKKLLFFPFIKNERSMLYIGNLVEFVRLMIDNEESGIFFPQNAEYSNTTEMVRLIASANNKHIAIIKGMSWLLRIISKFAPIVNKAFGNLSYDMEMSKYKEEYRKTSLKEAIEETEK